MNRSYRIEFEPRRNGSALVLDDYAFSSASEAIQKADEFNRAHNPAWNGTFYAINPEGKRI